MFSFPQQETGDFSTVAEQVSDTHAATVADNLWIAVVYFIKQTRYILCMRHVAPFSVTLVFLAIGCLHVVAATSPAEVKTYSNAPSAQQSVLEAYQEAELIVRGIGSRDGHIRRLRELQKSYFGRGNGQDIKNADLFWREVALQFLPALETGDGAAASVSFGRLVRIRQSIASTMSHEPGDQARADNTDNAAKDDGSSPPVDFAALLTSLKWVAIPVAAIGGLFWFRRRRQKRKLALMSDQAARRRETEKKAHDLLDVKLARLRNILYAYGPPRQENGKLFFGNYVVNGNNEIVDQVKKDFGCFATIFLGDKRIATNVLLSNGSRALDTPLVHGPAYETVVQKKRLFAGEVNLFGRSILSLYEPVFDGAAVIGILFVGS